MCIRDRCLVLIYLFDEKNAMAKLNYQYQERQNPFDYIAAIADSIANEDLSTYPRNTLLGVEYDSEKISMVASLLTPENCIINLMADPEKIKVDLNKKEKWFGAEYSLLPIPKKWMKTWANAEVNPNIRTADPNPFIPQNLSIVEQQGTEPELIGDNELGQAYYVRSSEFTSPSCVYHIHLFSPEINPSPRSLSLIHISEPTRPY